MHLRKVLVIYDTTRLKNKEYLPRNSQRVAVSNLGTGYTQLIGAELFKMKMKAGRIPNCEHLDPRCCRARWKSRLGGGRIRSYRGPVIVNTVKTCVRRMAYPPSMWSLDNGELKHRLCHEEIRQSMGMRFEIQRLPLIWWHGKKSKNSGVVRVEEHELTLGMIQYSLPHNGQHMISDLTPAQLNRRDVAANGINSDRKFPTLIQCFEILACSGR